MNLTPTQSTILLICIILITLILAGEKIGEMLDALEKKKAKRKRRAKRPNLVLTRWEDEMMGKMIEELMNNVNSKKL